MYEAVSRERGEKRLERIKMSLAHSLLVHNTYVNSISVYACEGKTDCMYLCHGF